ncbi:hypothetical protein T484DRAFT_1832671 [Baffinella frigidus]|nr:hypothetical protein T484DRAFT_1832671 [Cryptophyta sp. CCMP2293]
MAKVDGSSPLAWPILRRIQWHVRILAKSDFLQNFVQSIIVFNTVAMASDFKCEFDGTDDYCPYYKAMLECCNVFFAIVFTVELLIKVDPKP